MRVKTDVAALALGVGRKTLENLLGRESRSIVPPGRQGRSRVLGARELELIAVALVLGRDLGVPFARALALGQQLATDPTGEIAVGSLGRLKFDLKALRSRLRSALADAIEQIVPPRRGRPRSAANAKRGAS